MKSWKTTVAGAGTIAVALITIGIDLINGTVDGNKLSAQVTAIMGGVGLIFAKDFNVTGTGSGA